MKTTVFVFTVLSLAFAPAVVAAPLEVDVVGAGAQKLAVSINVGSPAFTTSLRRNLERSGLFVIKPDASVKVTGTPAGGVTVLGAGKSLSAPPVAGDDAAVRMAARRLADAMCEAYGNQKGFACDPIAFVKHVGKDNSEICETYPDGLDIRQLTAGGHAVVGPRWKDRHTLFYTNFRSGPQIWEVDTVSGKPKLRWSFKGVATGAVVSPDGARAAIILSFQGNPELYTIELASGVWTRLTKTPNASEGCPSWSPDGREIVYVSDETRHPQLYVINVATKATRRITSRGSQNVDPDWGKDGRITYVTKRLDGAHVAVLSPAEGDKTARFVTAAGNWEHPSWSRDGRNLVASCDKALYVVDTLVVGEQLNAPIRLFTADGRWIEPCWSK